MTNKEELLKSYKSLKSWHKRKLKLATEAGNPTMMEYFKKMVDHIDYQLNQLKYA